MFSNYLKLSIRNLLQRKGYSFLNIFGLALGMTGCLLILQYVNYERSYDDFHKKGEHIWRLRLDAMQDGRLAWQSATVYPAFGPTMHQDFPEVENACRLHDAQFVMSSPSSDERYAERYGYYADETFLEMFTMDFLFGEPKGSLTGPDKIVVSESTAKKYFGRTDVLGQQLLIRDPDLFQTYEITGVFRDLPKNSHLLIEYLVSYPTLQKIVNTIWQDTSNSTETSWGWYDFYTYLQLKPRTDIEAFKAKFPAFCDKYINQQYVERGLNSRNDIDIMPMQDIHLYSNVNQEAEVNGNGKAVSVLFLVAFLILGIAWINYVNLATARSVERGREVGVRKVMGAMRGQLIRQFLVESLILNLVSFVIALALSVLLMPAFSSLAGKEIPFSFLESPAFWGSSGIALLLGAGLAGLYPSFVLSAFQPVTVLKGALKNTSRGIVLRKTLTVFQFAMSIALIAATMIVFQQIQFMRNQNLGVDIHQTLVLEGAQTPIDSLYAGSFEPFRNEILKLPDVRNITASSSVPGDEIYWTNSFRVVSKGEQAPLNTMYHIGVDEHFLSSYDLHVIAGRPYSKNFGEDVDRKTIMFNETAIHTMGFESPEAALHQKVIRGRQDTFSIVGVTADFHHQSLQKSINPVVFMFYPDSRSYYSCKINETNTQALIASVETLWQKHFPNDPFTYFFLDEFYNKQYASDIQFGRVFSLFSLMAILVACLGLLGLSSYQILQRTKEIGIRKVLGATTGSIVSLLSRDFLKLVLLSFILASPVAYYVMQKWLSDYAYRINIPLWAFVVAGVVAILIAFITVSAQGVRAAVSNPVKSLRSE